MLGIEGLSNNLGHGTSAQEIIKQYTI